jgi:hypothetical protein
MRVQVSHSMQQRIPIQVFLFHTVLVRVLYLIPVEGRSVRTASPRPASAQTATQPHDHTAHHSTLPSTRQLSFLPFDFFLSFLLSSLLLPLHHHLVLSHCTSCSHFHISVPRLDPDPSSCSTSSPLPCPAAPRPFNPSLTPPSSPCRPTHSTPTPFTASPNHHSHLSPCQVFPRRSNWPRKRRRMCGLTMRRRSGWSGTYPKRTRSRRIQVAGSGLYGKMGSGSMSSPRFSIRESAPHL